ncbi:MAG: cyclic nucleotide-binding domain-containing protein [Rhodobacterales bacterium]|nr:cyclic nucleotide-binding domain-containing protein [Rhodobacterales bacterium]
MDFGDTVKVLRAIPMFAKLDPSKLKLVAFASAHLTFDDGEALFFEGDPSDGVYLIDEGTVNICVDSNGSEITVGSLTNRELFGEMAIFRNEPRSATIRASGSVKVLRIDGDMFLRVVTEYPETALEVMRILSEKIAKSMVSERTLQDRVQDLENQLGGGI